MGTNGSKKLSPFGLAAVALDEELERFQNLTASLQRLSLESPKNLERAAQTAEEATESQQRLGTRMQELIQGLATAREKNEQCAEVLRGRKAEIELRAKAIGGLVEHFGALAGMARDISQSAQRVGQEAKSGGAPEKTIAEMFTLVARIDEVINEAKELSRKARDAKVAELADQVESLRQQLLAARNKLQLTREKLTGTR
jgi:methyl-accepting chemotaxis protein